jgi:hypothetical protein
LLTRKTYQLGLTYDRGREPQFGFARVEKLIGPLGSPKGRILAMLVDQQFGGAEDVGRKSPVIGLSLDRSLFWRTQCSASPAEPLSSR